jgi:transcriptional regulator with XRE-family HTH domain
MKPNLFDKKIALTIKQIRQFKGITQYYISRCTNTTECNFGKYDHGDIAYTVGFLKEVSNCLEVDLLQICLINEGMPLKEVLHDSISVSLLKYISLNAAGRDNQQGLIEEISLLLEKLQNQKTEK